MRNIKSIAELLPLLKSSNPEERLTGIEIFSAHATAGHAPIYLQATIERLKNVASPETPTGAATQKAAEAATLAATQQQRTCSSTMPDGVYLHFQDKSQKNGAQNLGVDLKHQGLAFQGAQQVDVAPRQSEIRYYPAGARPEDLVMLIDTLAKHGLTDVAKKDISYLLHGCSPRAVYEVWLDADADIK